MSTGVAACWATGQDSDGVIVDAYQCEIGAGGEFFVSKNGAFRYRDPEYMLWWTVGPGFTHVAALQ